MLLFKLLDHSHRSFKPSCSQDREDPSCSFVSLFVDKALVCKNALREPSVS